MRKLPFTIMSALIKHINQNLDKVQSNILKPHGRKFVRCLFIQFSAEAKNVRKWIKAFAADEKTGITSAKQQHEASRMYRARHKAPEASGGVLTCFYLTVHGYEAMEIAQDFWPNDRSFRRGMEDGHVCGDFNDPQPWQWEDQRYKAGIHAMILLAGDSAEELEKREATINSGLEHVGQILFTEVGAKLPQGNQEHFGYQDGISQPPLWTPNKKWVLREGCKIVLDDALGSYMVFRKLKQQVERFNNKIKDLQQELGISQELAEAQVMGRFKDGTPLTLFSEAGRQSVEDLRLIKQFNLGKLGYEKDEQGLKCPLHAHIRKTNPRNNLQHLLGSYPVEIRHIAGRIIRNSIPYEEAGKEVGLLFMCYQRSIEVQFRVIQKSWSNDNGGSNPILRGVDPIIGKKWEHQPLEQLWNKGWGQPHAEVAPYNFDDVITFKGGALFYAPSIYFLNIGIEQVQRAS